MIRACIDTNVWISGILYSGPPADIIELAFKKKFQLVLSNFILEELQRNLIKKFEVAPSSAKKLIFRIAQIADVYEPSGNVKIVPDMHSDNLILETAMLGKSKYLVTGDRKHLLPLKCFHNIKIIEPNLFLSLIKKD